MLDSQAISVSFVTFCLLPPSLASLGPRLWFIHCLQNFKISEMFLVYAHFDSCSVCLTRLTYFLFFSFFRWKFNCGYNNNISFKAPVWTLNRTILTGFSGYVCVFIAPRMAGILVKIFAWFLESPIFGTLLLYILKGNNLIHKVSHSYVSAYVPYSPVASICFIHNIYVWLSVFFGGNIFGSLFFFGGSMFGSLLTAYFVSFQTIKYIYTHNICVYIYIYWQYVVWMNTYKQCTERI